MSLLADPTYEDVIRAILVLVLVAGGFTGVMAYLIALDEAQHRFTNRDRHRDALHSAASGTTVLRGARAVIGVVVSTMFH